VVKAVLHHVRVADQLSAPAADPSVHPRVVLIVVLVVALATTLTVLAAAALVATSLLRRDGRRRTRDLRVFAALGGATRYQRAAVDDEDPVSGPLNRGGLLSAAAAELRAGPVAVAALDLALLGPVTSTLGVAPAEQTVEQVAERLAGACASPAGVAPAAGLRACARMEGGTFAVVVSGLDEVCAGESLERLRAHLACPYVVDGLTFAPSVTVGLAWGDGSAAADGPAGTGFAALLLARAEVALGVARGSGPALRTYDPGMGERADRRVAVARGFTAALAEGHLSVSFQPTVSLACSTVVGVEALARWEHPELGALPPDEFVPVLEATGRVGALTAFVLDESLAEARGWLDSGLRLGVAVNVPVALLHDDSFPEAVAAARERPGVPAGLLTLELTESGVSSDRPAAVPAVRRLRRLGCRIAVDDFGTGQSSLAHLRGLPVDQLKIDKSFVLDMDGEQGVAVVRAIVEMGHSLGLTVVAEGVERTAERDALVALGCDVAQGFLVSRPLPAGCLGRWLASLDGELLVGGPRTLRVGGAV